MDVIEVGGTSYAVARATREDVPAIAELLRDDPLGRGRETEDLAVYETAFDEIDTDPRHLLAVVRSPQGEVVGTLQLTLLPGLARAGLTRLQVEGVRIAGELRGSGLGSAMLAWAHGWGRRHGAGVAQLTTDRQRTDAHRFYERLGYAPSHLGFKRELRG
jgi:GNAT superfamily N-acetyltransferase